ncbi:MAG: hypothetical protein J6A06_00470 [Fibrobacteraceae bacterium]|nr:hypothetical protein [Fibrobacteraceae bacterium]
MVGQNLGILVIESNSNEKAWLEYACQRLYRDATKAPELFNKSMKVYLNLAESEVAKHYNFVKSVDVEAMESYRK